MEIIFETTRLVLRKFTAEDPGLLLKLNSDSEVLKYLHEPRLQDILQAKEVLMNIILPQYDNNLGRWATYTKHNNEFIGWCGLKFRPEPDEIDLGYRFLKTAWGRGYATEAAIQTIDHGFKRLQLKTITGRAHVDNAASIRVLEKSGMKYFKEEMMDNCPVKTYVIQNENNF